MAKKEWAREIADLTGPDPDVRKDAAERLGAADDWEAHRALIEALDHRTVDIRLIAAEALGAARSEAAIPALVNALATDEASGVRQCAARSLGVIGSADRDAGVGALAALLDALNDPDQKVVRAAAKSLGEIGDPRVAANLVRLMSSPEAVIRQVCILALGQIKDGDALPPLVQALHDENWIVRQAAAQALGALGEQAAMLPLIEALEDANRSVRVAAEDALKRLNTSGKASEHP